MSHSTEDKFYEDNLLTLLLAYIVEPSIMSSHDNTEVYQYMFKTPDSFPKYLEPLPPNFMPSKVVDDPPTFIFPGYYNVIQPHNVLSSKCDFMCT